MPVHGSWAASGLGCVYPHVPTRLFVAGDPTGRTIGIGKVLSLGDPRKKKSQDEKK